MSADRILALEKENAELKRTIEYSMGNVFVTLDLAKRALKRYAEAKQISIIQGDETLTALLVDKKMAEEVLKIL